MCAVFVDTRPAQQPKTCQKSQGFSVNYNRVPNAVKNLTCYDRDECYSAMASVRVVIMNGTNSETKTLSVVAACLKRVTCPAGVFKDLSIKLVPGVNPSVLVPKVSCKKKGDEIFTMQPTINRKGDLYYKKVVYDCRCPCPGV